MWHPLCYAPSSRGAHTRRKHCCSTVFSESRPVDPLESSQNPFRYIAVSFIRPSLAVSPFYACVFYSLPYVPVLALSDIVMYVLALVAPFRQPLQIDFLYPLLCNPFVLHGGSLLSIRSVDETKPSTMRLFLNKHNLWVLLLPVRVGMVTPSRVQGHHTVPAQITVGVHAQVYWHAVHGGY